MNFEITEKEMQEIEKIKNALVVLFENYDIEYRFNNTAIGRTLGVYCKQIDKEYNITDYDSW